MPISDKYADYGDEVVKFLKKHDIRASIDHRSEKGGKKIRDAEVSKVPYMLIVGEKEASQQHVSVRRHGGEDLGSMGIQQFAEKIVDEAKL